MKIILGMILLCLQLSAQAMSLDWSGTYRFEWLEVDKPTLTNPKGRKAYGLNYLSLKSKVIASDGVNIVARFDLLTPENSVYVNSHLGQMWGSSSPLGARGAAENAAVDSSMGSGIARTSELYLTLNRDYNAILLGRAPFEFGLGINYSAGRGVFDHWGTTRDIVAYKIVSGNWSITPMIAKVSQPSAAQGNTITEEILRFDLDVQEGASKLSGLLVRKKGAKDAITASTSGATVPQYPGATAAANGMSVTDSNIYFEKNWTGFNFKMEGAFRNGETGLVNASNESILVSGYGLATELGFPQIYTNFDLDVKMGLASGDDGSTKDFEGFAFHRNYDVAMLLFNHRLGAADLLGTNLLKSQTLGVHNSFDDESISNAFYLSPTLSYKWNEHVDLVHHLTYAQLLTNSINVVDIKKDLGLELDIEVVYKPTKDLRWVNELGLLFPGSAFQANTGFENGVVYGISSKAAISF